MKKAGELKPNYAPLYAAAMYPDLAHICHEHGYALAIHGSVANDFDIIAIPWTKKVSTPRKLMNDIQKKFVIKFQYRERRNHGRIAYTCTVGFGVCRLDFSFFPTTPVTDGV